MTARKKAARPAADFLTAVKAHKIEEVDVPGFGKVWAHGLTRGEMGDLTDAALQPGKKAGEDGAFDSERLTLLIIGASIRDAKGNRLIPHGREAELDEVSPGAFAAMQNACLRVNGMGAAEGN